MNQTIAKPETKIRESNFELLRIIAMFMVLVLHADFQALGAPTRADIISSPIVSTLKVFFEMASIVAVNVFILISGWFGIRPSVKGFCKFVFQCLFFSVGVYLVMLLLDRDELSLRGIAGCLMLIPGSSYWFIPSYVCLYLFSPVLNAFIKVADKKAFRFVLLAFFAFQTVFSFMANGANFLMRGYSAMSFMGLYLLAAYVREHTDTQKCQSRIFYGGGYVLITILLSVIWVYASWQGLDFVTNILPLYSNPLIILSSLLLLLYFSRITITCRILNKIAASCFAVYLFHCHPTIYTYYLDSIKMVSGSNLICVIGIIMLWYLLSILLDLIRIALYRCILRF